MQLSLIESSFSTVKYKVKKSNSENSAMLFWMPKTLLIVKKANWEEIARGFKTNISKKRKNSWKLYFISIIAYFFHWIFFCIFVMYYSEAIFLVTQSKQIRLFGLQLNVYSRHSFSIWNGKEWASREKKKSDGSVSNKCIFMLNHGIYSAMSFK